MNINKKESALRKFYAVKMSNSSDDVSNSTDHSPQLSSPGAAVCRPRSAGFRHNINSKSDVARHWGKKQGLCLARKDPFSVHPVAKMIQHSWSKARHQTNHTTLPYRKMERLNAKIVQAGGLLISALMLLPLVKNLVLLPDI